MYLLSDRITSYALKAEPEAVKLCLAAFPLIIYGAAASKK